jgi:integrase
MKSSISRSAAWLFTTRKRIPTRLSYQDEIAVRLRPSQEAGEDFDQPMMRCAIDLALLTGLRRGDLLKLTRAQCHDEGYTSRPARPDARSSSSGVRSCAPSLLPASSLDLTRRVYRRKPARVKPLEFPRKAPQNASELGAKLVGRAEVEPATNGLKDPSVDKPK